MTQLTSISNLRKSPAIQSRVDNVERFLKALNPAWKAEWFFPIAVINVSNDQADCSWVRDHTGTHHKGDGNLFIGAFMTTADAVIQNLKGLRLNSEADYPKLHDALKSAFGAVVDWTQGMALEAAVTQAPFAQKAVETKPALEASGSIAKAKKSSSVKPIAVRKTKLDDAKALFSDLTPKQKVDLMVFVQEKVGASKACQEITSKGVSAAQVGA